jgi:capsid assembly protease
MLETLLARFKDSPALVAPEGQHTFEGCLSALSKMEDFSKLMTERSSNDNDDNFWPAPDNWRAAYRPYSVRNGILTIPVKGVLLHDFAWQIGSWATGYDYIWRAFQRGQNDPEVRGIAFLIHSPGGDVAGNFDMVDRMFAMRGQKPVRAFASEFAYSAAYSIASVADKLVMSRTGGVGSIGVVTAHFDVSEMMKENGYKITFIHFGKHKVDGNPYEALKPEVKARIQARIDELGGVFVATVARNRGLDEDVVRGTEALTYSASEAMSIGLADEVGPLDDAMAAFVADLSNREGEEQMGDKTPAAVDQAAIETARSEGIAQGKKEGAIEERQRISAILDSEAGKKRPAAAFAAALDTDMSVEAATSFIAKLPEEAPKASAEQPSEEEAKKTADEQGADFSKAMKESGNPEVGADGSKGGSEETRAQRTARMMGWTGKAA